MNSATRDRINRANAALSTGPKTPEGKQRASMNAVTHGLTGQRMILQEHEHEAYRRLTEELNAELKPATGMERQLVQKIIDGHTRLNRIAALDNNILNIGLLDNSTQTPHDGEMRIVDEQDRPYPHLSSFGGVNPLVGMVAQTRSWLDNDTSFEKLGRYEARISRQLLAYTKELERLQVLRREREREQARAAGGRSLAGRIAALRMAAQALEIKPDDSKMASFCSTPQDPETPGGDGLQPVGPNEVRPLVLPPTPNCASDPHAQAA